MPPQGSAEAGGSHRREGYQDRRSEKAGGNDEREDEEQQFITGLNDSDLLTKLDYLESWALGARVLACRPASSVGVDPWPLTPKKSSPSQITAR
jgi:hypothetical protein